MDTDLQARCTLVFSVIALAVSIWSAVMIRWYHWAEKRSREINEEWKAQYGNRDNRTS